jgi:hypothetical protein
MTIVDLSDLDTFIRDSLYEVRKGIANSRNATQANPMLGVMVDLPEKVDFEIMVTTAYQSLSRNSIAQDSDSVVELSSENQQTTSKSTEYVVGGGLSLTSSSATESSTDASKEIGSNTESGSGSESNSENENKNGTTTGADQNTETRNGTTRENKSNSDKKQEKSTRTEQHLEANDRASKAFDEDTGAYGGQGQIATPSYEGGSPCSCG